MTDNEMRNLILQAATLLEVQRDREKIAGERATIAALAHGAAVLRMVAACMVTETAAVPSKPAAQRDERGQFVRRSS